MNKIIFTFSLIFSVISFANPNQGAFYIGSPLELFDAADKRVKSEYPDSRLLFISTFGMGKPDPNCSQIGWQFVYDDNVAETIRISFRHLPDSTGDCRYIEDKDLTTEGSLAGYGYMEGKLDSVLIEFDDALKKAQATAGNKFRAHWAKLIVPLHPLARGRLFWNFRGPVVCNKGAEIAIDSNNGDFEPYFSTVPSCP